MASGGDFRGCKLIDVKQTDALTLSARMNAVFGDTAAILARPDNRRFLAYQSLADGFYIKPGRWPGVSFLDADVTAADAEITMTAHGFTAGDGP